MALKHFTLQFDPNAARHWWHRLQGVPVAERRAALQAGAREVARSPDPYVQQALAMARHDPGALSLPDDDDLAQARLWLLNLIGQAGPALSLDPVRPQGGASWHVHLMQALPAAGWQAEEINLLLRGEPLGRCFAPPRGPGESLDGPDDGDAARLDDLAGWLDAAHAKWLRARLASASEGVDPQAVACADRVLAQASGPDRALLVWLD